MQRIGVIGGGASGTITAARLLEKVGADVEVALIDPSDDPGPGIPYRTRNPDHLLNVIAGRMSAIEEDRDGFLRWAREKDPSIDAGTYVSRGVYGEYLRDLLRSADEARPEGSRGLRIIQAEVESIERDGDGLVLGMKGSPPIRCDQVVLAVGALPGGDPVPVPGDLRKHGLVVSDVWEDEWLSATRDDDVVLIAGTGLTMVDATLSICRSRRGPRVIAVSRGGLFPKAHRDGYLRLDSPELPGEGPISLEQALAMFLSLEANAREKDGDWRDAMDAMRRVTPAIWRRMPLEDRRRFLEESCRTWEVHRFRMAPEVSRQFSSLMDRGRLEVLKGRMLRVEPSSGGVAVDIESETGPRTLQVDRVINCTGAGREVSSETAPLLASMIAKDLVREDVLRMGLDVLPDGRAIEGTGDPSPNISVVGPLRRGVEWEAIGITEIRVQAAGVAERLATEAAMPEPLPPSPS